MNAAGELDGASIAALLRDLDGGVEAYRPCTTHGVDGSAGEHLAAFLAVTLSQVEREPEPSTPPMNATSARAADGRAAGHKRRAPQALVTSEAAIDAAIVEPGGHISHAPGLRGDRPLAQPLAMDDIAGVRDGCIDAMVEVTSMSKAEAEIVLKKFAWNAEHAVGAQFAGELSAQPATAPARDPVPGQAARCGVCLESTVLVAAPVCGHAFCSECWMRHIDLSSDHASGITCMEPSCLRELTTACVEALAPPAVARRVNSWALERFVRDSACMQWCRTCTRPLRGAPDETGEARCPCGAVLCYLCGRKPHHPLACGELEQFLDESQRCLELKRRRELAARLERLLARGVNTDGAWRNLWRRLQHGHGDGLEEEALVKECPGCRVPISKAGGCDHMTCSQCSQEFCWLCRRQWTGGPCPCAAEVPPISRAHALAALQSLNVGSLSAEECAREDRFLQYHRRFQHHAAEERNAEAMDAATIAGDLEEALARRGHVVRVREGAEALVQCHAMLKLLWVHACLQHSEGSLYEHKIQRLSESTADLTVALGAAGADEASGATVVRLVTVVRSWMVAIRNDLVHGAATPAPSSVAPPWTWPGELAGPDAVEYPAPDTDDATAEEDENDGPMTPALPSPAPHALTTVVADELDAGGSPSAARTASPTPASGRRCFPWYFPAPSMAKNAPRGNPSTEAAHPP